MPANSPPTVPPRLKKDDGDADVTGIMAEADPTPRRSRPSVPAGLLHALTLPTVIRLDEVARGRRRAADRSYDDGRVVVEIASQLLSLSAR